MRVTDKQKNLNVIEDEAQLTDLGLTDEELDGIKGGRLTGAEEDGGGGIGGDWIINHNETIVSDNEIEAQLSDFGLTDEELDGIKGGRLTGAEEDGGGGMGGDWVINHNETTLSEEVGDHLADFGLTDEELDGIKGGREDDGGGGGMGGDWVINHNETILIDTPN